jgi:hypothetical protein
VIFTGFHFSIEDEEACEDEHDDIWVTLRRLVPVVAIVLVEKARRFPAGFLHIRTY